MGCGAVRCGAVWCGVVWCVSLLTGVCSAAYPLQVRFADNTAQKKLKSQAVKRRGVHPNPTSSSTGGVGGNGGVGVGVGAPMIPVALYPGAPLLDGVTMAPYGAGGSVGERSPHGSPQMANNNNNNNNTNAFAALSLVSSGTSGESRGRSPNNNNHNINLFHP